MNACRNSLVLMLFRSHFWCPERPFFHECLQDFIGCYALEVSFRMSFKSTFLMNACRNSLVFMPFRSHFCCPQRPFFHECLQEFIGFNALQVSLLMSWKAFFSWMPAGFHCFLCPLGLILNVLKGLFSMNACGNSWVLMPFRFHFWCPARPLFNECLQEFIGFNAL